MAEGVGSLVGPAKLDRGPCFSIGRVLGQEEIPAQDLVHDVVLSSPRPIAMLVSAIGGVWMLQYISDRRPLSFHGV